MTTKKLKFDRFPGGVHKAVTFSFDDGRTHDRRLVEVMNRYGLKGTFHLNSGFFGHDGYISGDEVAELYKGHEVSAHTVTHPFLEQSPMDQVAEEILSDRQALESLVGYPVRGMSYPFGSYNNRVVEALPALGIEYSRTVQSHGGFSMPEDPLRWHPTCHHKTMVEKAEEFMQLQPYRNRWQLLFIWGHSYEFENDNNWELMVEVGERLGGQEGVWHATMAEVLTYHNAVLALRFSVDRSCVNNPSATDVWVSVNGESTLIPAGRTLRL
ncbi:polysaccharide deacetylase family protein [Paenibacillus sp. strain BS8-2]